MRREKLGNGTLFLNPGSRLLTPFQKMLQCYSILENGNFTIAVALVASLLATGYGNNLINKLLYQLLHVGAFYQGACVEVNPVWLVLGQIAVGRNLHGWNEGAEWGTTTGGEEHELAT